MGAPRAELEFHHTVLQHEIDYRRRRRSDIFTWANTILLAITGGSIALQQQSGASLTLSQRLVVSFAVVVLAAYSILWWLRQRELGRALKARLRLVERDLGIEAASEGGTIPDWIGSVLCIVLLAAAAIASTLASP